MSEEYTTGKINIDSRIWMDFVDECQACTDCQLCQTRDQVVVWRGSVPAPLMIVGEGPGAEEDRLGKPFVGRSGQLLDRLLRAQEFHPNFFHICNIVKCRPPENRTPTEEEATTCKQHLARQFKLVKPKIIVLCGATAYRYFTGRKEAISKVRGTWLENNGYYIMPTYHPAYILRDPRQRSKMWDDFVKVRQKLTELGFASACSDPLVQS